MRGDILRRGGSSAADYQAEPHAYAIPPSNLGGRMQREGFNEEEIRAELGKPVEFRELMRKGGESPFGNGLDVVKGHTPLAPRLDVTKHMPYYPEAAVIQQGVPRQLGIPGRIADMEVTTSPVVGGGGQSKETYTAMYQASAPGEIYRQTRVIDKARRGEYSPFEGMTYAFAVFKVDPNAEHPMEALSPQLYGGQGDFRLYDVMTSSDANPQNSYMHRTRPEFDEEGEITALHEEAALLSEISLGYEEGFRKKLQHIPGAREKVIDGVIAAFGRQFSESDYNMFQGRHSRNPQINQAIKSLVEGYYLQVDTPDGWRIPVRAHLEFMQMKRHDSVKGKSSAGIEARKDNIRKEVLQALGMVHEADEIRTVAALLAQKTGQPVANPIRWTMQGIDQVDRSFARTLGKIEVPPYAIAAKGIARMYKQLPKNARLLINPTPGNHLTRIKSLKGESYGSRGSFVYSEGDDMPISGQHGAFPEWVSRSVYDLDEELMMDGVVGIFDSNGPQLSQSQRFLVINLLKAPGMLLQQVEEMGYFEKGKPGLNAQPTLAEMLLARDNDPTVQIAHIDQARGASVVAAVKNEGVAELVLSADKKVVDVRIRSIVEAYKAARNSSDSDIRGSVSRRDKRYMRGQYDVTETGKKSGETTLAGLALHKGAPYGWAPMVPDDPLLTMNVMRSEYIS